MAYNGWTNYETWNCNLWLTNEYFYYAAIRDCIADFEDLDQEEQVEELANIIGTMVYDMIEEVTNPMMNDWCDAFYREVDFMEIAEAFLAE